MISQLGIDGMVYRGDPNLIHISDGKRAIAGRAVAGFLDATMRDRAEGRTELERVTQPLCPGCYMVAMYDALLALADASGQSRRELGLTMSLAFTMLAANPDRGLTEEIKVVLDPC